MLISEMFNSRRRALLEARRGCVFVWIAERADDTKLLNDIFYLTGIYQAPLGLVLGFNECGEVDATLFVAAVDPVKAHWEGFREGIGEVQVRVGDGVKVQEWTANGGSVWAHIEARLGRGIETTIGYRLGNNLRQDTFLIESLEKICKMRRVVRGAVEGMLSVVDPLGVMTALRIRKNSFEVQQLTRASDVTVRGYLEMLGRDWRGKTEVMLAKHIEGGFAEAGGEALAYPTIVAFGEAATCLHHAPTLRRAGEGELVLVDAGAKVGGYVADVTRVFPVSGRFTEAQAAVYDVVLEAQEAAIGAIRVGAAIDAPHKAAVVVLEGALGRLGLGGDVARWFTHQTGHWVGLDVHDVGPRRPVEGCGVFEEGMCLTVEPGLYIGADAEDAPEVLRGIGIRIEDTVLVEGGGVRVLTGGVPKVRGEVEEMLRGVMEG